MPVNMLSRVIVSLGSPELVASFQRMCGVELVSTPGLVPEIDTGAKQSTPTPGAVGGNESCVAEREDRTTWVQGSAQSGTGSTTVAGVADTTSRNRVATSGAGDVRLRDCRPGSSKFSSTANNNNDKYSNNNHGSTHAGSNPLLQSHCNHQGTNGWAAQHSCSNGKPAAVIASNGITTATATNGRPTTYKSIDTAGCEAAVSNGGAGKRCACFSWAEEAPDPTTMANGSASGSSPSKQRRGPTRVFIRYPVLYYLAKLGAFLGNEEFYLSGMPLMMWAVDSAIVRRTAVIWWLVMYLGQATKDYLGWARPASPPVAQLETEHLAEFSMPSTHAMAGTAIPLLLATMFLERYELPWFPVVFVFTMWWTLTCLSRIYLGVHTFLDILCGVAYALGVYAVFYPLMDGYDVYQQTHSLAPVVMVTASLALCTFCYPASTKGTTRDDAIAIAAVVVGTGVGAWLNLRLGLSQLTPSPQRGPVSMSPWWLAATALQLVTGVGVVGLVKVTVTWASVRLFSWLMGLDVADRSHPAVMVGYKYTTYFSLGVTISCLNPLIFTLLGFGRPGYYLEVV